MCEISTEIKLCSCTDKGKSSLDTWVLKANSALNTLMVGEIISPTYHGKELEYGNFDLLLKKLNSNNLFDFDYAPEDDDQLEIRICVNKVKSEYLNYTFYYQGGWTDLWPISELKFKKIKYKGVVGNALIGKK